MPLILADRVKETITSPGTTVNITLSGATTGFRSFGSVMSINDTCYYTIADQVGANWEVGLAIYLGSNAIARHIIYDSSNSGSIVNFSSGTQDVFITYAADRAIDQSRALINNMVYGI